jgi:uncharacterized membrane protein
METEVNQLSLFVATILGLGCIAAFLYLIDYAARMLRPVSIVARVSELGLAVIESVYPVDTCTNLPARAAVRPPGQDRPPGSRESAPRDVNRTFAKFPQYARPR